MEVSLSNRFIIAATEHGRHGPALVILVAIAVVGPLVYVVTRRRRFGAERRGRRAPRNARAKSPTTSGTEPIVSLSVDRRPRPGLPFTQPPPRNPVVTVTSLTKQYGEVLAVDDLSFALEAGTVTGFLGPNGAGKTTTLRLLLGLAEPTAGEALVFGRCYQELD